MKAHTLFIALFLLFVIGMLYLWSVQKKQIKQTATQSSSSPIVVPVQNASSSAVLGARTKTSDCHISNSLPDPQCTPGAIFSNVTKEEICQLGYTGTVRNVTIKTKSRVYAEYGITSHTAGEYEVDHLISLELGGSNDIANLWPEAAEPRPGYHEKDKVENYLHQLVCKGTMSLEEAQHEIVQNWVSIYDTIK